MINYTGHLMDFFVVYPTADLYIRRLVDYITCNVKVFIICSECEDTLKDKQT
jgi:hypothetical protein